MFWASSLTISRPHARANITATGINTAIQNTATVIQDTATAMITATAAKNTQPMKKRPIQEQKPKQRQRQRLRRLLPEIRAVRAVRTTTTDTEVKNDKTKSGALTSLFLLTNLPENGKIVS